MNVSLTPELETLINNKVKSGLYNSASEVVREALRLLEEQDRIREIRLEDLRREVMKGVEDLRAGRYTTLETKEDFEQLAEDIKRRGRERLAARKKQEQSK
jgi:antitoxin ParD1/3/4